MLVLKRKRGQGIKIDDDVLITITAVHVRDGEDRLVPVSEEIMEGMEISIGIDAPRSRAIRREEVWNKEGNQ